VDHHHPDPPLHHDVRGTTTREQLVANQRVVYRHAMGLQTVESLSLESLATGTRLNFTVTLTSPIPLLDRLWILIASPAKGHAHSVDRVLAEIKRKWEGGRDSSPGGPIPTPITDPR
jgi:hypothetical protein